MAIKRKSKKETPLINVYNTWCEEQENTPVELCDDSATVHPSYYNALPNGIECWDVTEHFKGNIAMSIKHLWRAGKKPGQDLIQDYKKAIQYIQREIDLASGKTGSMVSPKDC
jgi:hypothetical protein